MPYPQKRTCKINPSTEKQYIHLQTNYLYIYVMLKKLIHIDPSENFKERLLQLKDDNN